MSTVLWLASNNKKKVAELQRMLAPLDCEIRTPDQLKEPFEPVEDQPDFAGNARKKAVMLAKLARGLALGDDSGLCVDVLGGRPGVLSARYGGPELDDRGRMMRLLESLRAVPPGQRNAHFTCHCSSSRPAKAASATTRSSCRASTAPTRRARSPTSTPPTRIASATAARRCAPWWRGCRRCCAAERRIYSVS